MHRHLADDEELFPDIVEQLSLTPPTRRITCSGCAQPVEVDADGPELCRLCAAEPAATRVRIASVRAGAEARRLAADQCHETEHTAASLATCRSVLALTAPILARCEKAEAALNIIAPMCANPESTTQ
jgi:hypothetical protein